MPWNDDMVSPVKVIRLSFDGFQPKNQDYRLNVLREFQKPLDTTGLTEWQTHLATESYQKSLPLLAKLDFSDWESGVFAFISQLPEQHWIDHELNHLTKAEKSKRTWFEGEICLTDEIYSPYGLIPELFTVEKYLTRYWPGAAVYIPARTKVFNCRQL